MSQSSNDTYPTAMHIAAVEAIETYLVHRVMLLRDTLDAKSKQFMDVVKIGRTHLHGCDAADAGAGDERLGRAARPRAIGHPRDAAAAL